MKTNNETIAFVGAGNVAWHLAPALDNAGYIVSEVYSRDAARAKQLVSRLYQAEIKTSLDFSSSDARVIILAVADDAIGSVAGRIFLPEGATLIHTSGSSPLSLLDPSGIPDTGVFYPLQTFSKDVKVTMGDIPVFIEGRNSNVTNLLMQMGKAIGSAVFSIPTEKRLALHLAGVFASNFTNHILGIAFDLMRRNELDPQWLEPLIAETINKSLEAGPDIAQTGPARRGDLEILRRHAQFLKNDKKLREIYTLISQHILDKYQS